MVLVTNRYANPLVAQLIWSNHSGTLQLKQQKSQVPLVNLPWQLDDQYLTVKQGEWSWQSDE
ncbi:MAG: hypothetical protein AB8W37_10395 [Arsenophonus endosymbiont of Dermacentor nuttalli]